MSTADTLEVEEAWRAFVYDDATGQPITKGTLVQGYPTIGFGFCIDAFKGAPMPQEIGDAWLALIIRATTAALTERWAPFAAQPLEVQGALVEMAYQLGVDGLFKSPKMLEALRIGNRSLAAQEALDGPWHQQTPQRAERVAARLRGV